MIQIQNYGRDKLLKYFIPLKPKDRKLSLATYIDVHIIYMTVLTRLWVSLMLPFWKIMLIAKTHIMCGDYNVDLLKVTDRQFNDDYFNHILSAGYISKLTLPTRLSDNSTLIDNVFTTNLNTDLSAYTCILDIHIRAEQ